MHVTRKDFLRFTVFFGGVAAAAALSGCSSTSDAGNAASCSKDGAKDGAITSNHGHVLQIPASDFTSPKDGTYDIAGSAGHSHTVSLTAAQLTQLAGGTSVTVTSTTTLDHHHDVTVVCA